MKTLYSKYVLFTIMMFAISMTISLLITNAIYHQIMKEQNDANYVSLITSMTDYIEESPPTDLEAYLTHLGDIGYQLYLVDDTGDGQFFGGDFREATIDDKHITSVLAGETYHGIKAYPRNLFITGFFSNDLSNSVGKSFTYEDREYAMFIRINIKMLFSEMHFIIGGLFSFILIVNIVASIFAARYLLKPIKRLSEATKLVATDHYDIPLDVDRADEIGLLSRNFKQMTAELKHQREAQKSFIRNVSHDFQTPLQNISGYAKLIVNDADTPTKAKQYGETIAHESDRLSHLTKQLLLWQNASKYIETEEKVALDQVIKRVVQEQQYNIQEKELSLWLNLEALTVIGSETFLTHMIENLLSNAIKYSHAFADITIIGKETANGVTVTMSDEGIGMNEEDITHLFQPFYRADNARSTVGTGLGLFIVKEVVDMHKARITVTSKPQEGTSFTIIFPK